MRWCRLQSIRRIEITVAHGFDAQHDATPHDVVNQSETCASMACRMYETWYGRCMAHVVSERRVCWTIKWPNSHCKRILASMAFQSLALSNSDSPCCKGTGNTTCKIVATFNLSSTLLHTLNLHKPKFGAIHLQNIPCLCMKTTHLYCKDGRPSLSLGPPKFLTYAWTYASATHPSAFMPVRY